MGFCCLWRRRSSSTVPLAPLGCAQLLKISPPLAQPASVSARARLGTLGSQRWGAATRVPPQSKQAAGTPSGANSPELVASGLVLTEAETHLLCVKSLLVKWLRREESLLLLLNNHREPNLPRRFPSFLGYARKILLKTS